MKGLKMNYPMPIVSPMGQVTNLTIPRLLITETGTYHDQFIRPLHLDVRAENIANVNAAISSTGSISPSNLAGITGEFFKVSAIPEAVAPLVNGWNTKRCRFLMEIAYERAGMRTSEMVSGYSDHLGVSTINGTHLDPNMVFYVNNITTIRVDPIFTADGAVQHVSRVVDNSHVLNDHLSSTTNPNQAYWERPNMYDIRPQDVVHTLSLGLELEKYNPHQVLDGVSILRSESKLSNRANNVPVTYASKLLNAFNTAQAGMLVTGGEEFYTEVSGMVRDSLAAHSAFLNKIRNVTSVGGGKFTWSDLLAIDPSLNQRKSYVPLREVTKDFYTTADSQQWSGADLTTQYATILAQVIPSLMAEVGLTQINFTSTNNYNLGATLGITTRVISGNTFSSGISLAGPSEVFKQRFEAHVLKDLTYNNQLQFNLVANFDLIGESKIQLSVDNGPLTPYTVPSFADNSFSPMLTFNPALPNQVASQMLTMFESINLPFNNSLLSPNQPQPVFNPHQPIVNAYGQPLTQPVVMSPYGI